MRTLVPGRMVVTGDVTVEAQVLHHACAWLQHEGAQLGFDALCDLSNVVQHQVLYLHQVPEEHQSPFRRNLYPSWWAGTPKLSCLCLAHVALFHPLLVRVPALASVITNLNRVHLSRLLYGLVREERRFEGWLGVWSRARNADGGAGRGGSAADEAGVGALRGHARRNQ